MLGYGFLEKVYQRAMQVELIERGLKAEIETRIKLMFKGVIVGEYQADLWVADQVIVGIKVAKEHQSADETQLLNELKATGVKVGLLINFGRARGSSSRDSSTDSYTTKSN